MEIGKQWSRISIIRSYQRNVYPAGDKSCCLHQWTMEHVLCMCFGFCVCRWITNCSILIALLFHYFSHFPRSYRGTSISISCWQKPCLVLLGTCRKLFTSWSNLKFVNQSYFSLLQTDGQLLAMNFSGIIQIRFGPLVTKLHAMSTYFVATLMHSFIQWIVQRDNKFFSHSNRQPLRSFLSQPHYSVLQWS